MDAIDPARRRDADPLLALLQSLSREDFASTNDCRASLSDPPRAGFEGPALRTATASARPPTGSRRAEITFDLRLCSLATFRTVTFTIGLALFTHLRGSLASSLAPLNTLVGFGAFLVLWITTAFATRIGLRHRAVSNAGRRSRSTGGAGFGSTLEATIVAGAWNGVFIFLAFVGGTLVVAVGLGPGLITVMFGSVIGATIAFALGGVFGLVYGLVESTLFAISMRVADWIDAPMIEQNATPLGSSHA